MMTMPGFGERQFESRPQPQTVDIESLQPGEWFHLAEELTLHIARQPNENGESVPVGEIRLRPGTKINFLGEDLNIQGKPIKPGFSRIKVVDPAMLRGTGTIHYEIPQENIAGIKVTGYKNPPINEDGSMRME